MYRYIYLRILDFLINFYTKLSKILSILKIHFTFIFIFIFISRAFKSSSRNHFIRTQVKTLIMLRL